MSAPTTKPRPYGTGWQLRPASDKPDAPVHFPDVWVSSGAARWYWGAAFTFGWMIQVIIAVVTASTNPMSVVAGIIVSIVFMAGFLMAAPLAWALGSRGRLWVCGGLFALSFALFPWIGFSVSATWTYVGVVIGMCVFTWRVSAVLIAVLGLLALLFGYLAEGWRNDIVYLPALIVSLATLMGAFARTIASAHQVRAAQHHLELLAAERERGRVARDIHDILGHSLTVITVKSELARRLIDADPARAKNEIAEIETLARGALADVRSAVSGFREVSITSELAAARGALEATGIAAELPSSSDAVRTEHRELAGWVVREGVTNVIRHSHATRCRVHVSDRLIEIDDDGVGPSAAGASSTGLEGLRGRVDAAGGHLLVGRSALGGFRLEVRL